RLTAHTEQEIELTEKYAKANDFWWDKTKPEPTFSSVLELDLSTVVPCLAGPKRPQDRVELTSMKAQWHKELVDSFGKKVPSESVNLNRWAGEGGEADNAP